MSRVPGIEFKVFLSFQFVLIPKEIPQDKTEMYRNYLLNEYHGSEKKYMYQKVSLCVCMCVVCVYTH